MSVGVGIGGDQSWSCHDDDHQPSARISSCRSKMDEEQRCLYISASWKFEVQPTIRRTWSSTMGATSYSHYNNFNPNCIVVRKKLFLLGLKPDLSLLNNTGTSTVGWYWMLTVAEVSKAFEYRFNISSIYNCGFGQEPSSWSSDFIYSRAWTEIILWIVFMKYSYLIIYI